MSGRRRRSCPCRRHAIGRRHRRRRSELQIVREHALDQLSTFSGREGRGGGSGTRSPSAVHLDRLEPERVHRSQGRRATGPLPGRSRSAGSYARATGCAHEAATRHGFHQRVLTWPGKSKSRFSISVRSSRTSSPARVPPDMSLKPLSSGGCGACDLHAASASRWNPRSTSWGSGDDDVHEREAGLEQAEAQGSVQARRAQAASRPSTSRWPRRRRNVPNARPGRWLIVGEVARRRPRTSSRERSADSSSYSTSNASPRGASTVTKARRVRFCRRSTTVVHLAPARAACQRGVVGVDTIRSLSPTTAIILPDLPRT